MSQTNVYCIELIRMEFRMERRVLELPDHAIITFRTCNHKLAVDVGRYQNVDRNLRNCDLCNLYILGDDYHL